jgi:hypothetical protein
MPPTAPVASATGDDYKRQNEIRANIRDMARWLIVFLGAVVSVAIGASTLTQVASLDVGVRQVTAIALLVAALTTCVPAFFKAVDLMTMKLRGREEVFTSPEFQSARDKVEKSLLPDNIYIAYTTFRSLDETYEIEQAKVMLALARNDTPDLEDLLTIRQKVQAAAEFARVEYDREKFEEILSLLKKYLPIFAILITAFTLVANPAKPEAKKQITPVLVKANWFVTDEGVLEGAGLSKECLAMGHPKLFVLSDGLRPDVLAIPEELKGGACKVVRVTLDSDNHLAPAQ